jgi:hypothetical protein
MTWAPEEQAVSSRRSAVITLFYSAAGTPGLQHDQIRLLTPGNLKALHRTGTEFCIHDPAIPCRDDTIPDLGWHARRRKPAHLLRADRDHFIFRHQPQDLCIPVFTVIIFTVLTCQTGTDHEFHS